MVKLYILLMSALDGYLQVWTADIPSAEELSWHSTQHWSSLPSQSHALLVLKGL